MKKFLFLTLVFGAIMSTTTNAQTGGPAEQTKANHAQGGDPAVMLQRIKDDLKPGMMEKTGLTEAQVDKVIELNFEMRMAASGLSGLSEADRSAKISELKAAKEKKMNELLTPAQQQSVQAFYQENARNRQQKAGN